MDGSAARLYWPRASCTVRVTRSRKRNRQTDARRRQNAASCKQNVRALREGVCHQKLADQAAAEPSAQPRAGAPIPLTEVLRCSSERKARMGRYQTRAPVTKSPAAATSRDRASVRANQ